MAFVYNPNGNKMDQMVHNEIECYLRMHLTLNCFLDDFICVFTLLICTAENFIPISLDMFCVVKSTFSLGRFI